MAMANETNAHGQPIGPALPGWTKRELPPTTPLIGRYCRLEKLDADRHLSDLDAAFKTVSDGRDWTYLPYGPFIDFASYSDFMQKTARQIDPLHHAIIDVTTDRAIGSFALMRIDPDSGVIEIGHVAYSPLLQRSRVGTEAMYLLLRRVFDELAYRRCEWKCDDLNLPSRKAAERYGFQYEGTFRQAVVYKGRSRDTAWYSIVDREWPILRTAFEQWLSPENFDESGQQRQALAALRSSVK